MDATGTERAVSSRSRAGAQRALLLAAEHPERGRGAVFICPAVPLGEAAERADVPFDEELDTDEGWAKYNRHYWLRDYRGFLEFFFSQMFTEPHSTKPIEDCVGWGLETTPETLDRDATARPARRTTASSASSAARVRCPVLVIQGDRGRDHRPRPRRRRSRRRPAAQLVDARGLRARPARPRPGQGQPAAARLHRAAGAAPRAGCAGASRRKRALYVSSPIGLGHAQRDVAIADELRKLHPDLEIDWLAQHPVTAVLEARGERIHPASAQLANESRHIESESAEHDLHCFQAIRRMDEILLANFMVFHDVVREEHYDLWIGDEAWELDYYLHENPEQKRAAYVWLTDFVGWLPMPDGGEREAFLTADYNAEMIEHIARFPRVRDRAIFVGDPDDIVPDALRPGPAADPRLDARALRLRRLRHRLRPGGLRRPRGAARTSSATAPDERSASSPSAAPASAAHLLRRVIDAFPEAQRARAGAADDRRRRAAHRPAIAARARRARGPRLRPRPLPPPRRVRPRRRPGRADDGDGADRQPAPVPLLPARATTSSRTSTSRHRLERYGAGRRMDFDTATPDDDRRRDRRGDRPRGRLPAGRRPTAPRARRALIAELL